MAELEEYKEQIMAALYKSPQASLFLGRDILKIDRVLENKTITLAIKELKLEGLIEHRPGKVLQGDPSYKLSDYGYSLMKEHKTYSACKKYLQAKKIKQEEKTIHEAKLSRWQVVAFWPVLIGGFIGSLCGVIALVMQLTDKHSQQPIQIQIEQKKEDTISTSHKPSTIDSTIKH